MRPEQRVNNALRDAVNRHTTGIVRLNRVENYVGEGTPDINGCIGGREFWVESKAHKEPVRPTTPLFGSGHKFELSQINWHLKQAQAGGRSYLFIGTDKRWLLLPGTFAPMANAATVAEMLKAALWSAQKPTIGEEWKRLVQILAR